MSSVLHIERLVAGGDALAREENGRVVFVNGALPGETVQVDFTAEKKDFARARVVEILEASPDRREVPCEHRREGCGGCPWMHLRPDAQLAAKAEIVRESLRRVGRLDADRVDELVTVGSSVDPVGYRTTIRVAGGVDGRPGFRREASDEVVPVTSCRTAHPNLVSILDGVRITDGELTLRTSAATGKSTAVWSGVGDEPTLSGAAASVHLGSHASLKEQVAGEWFQVSAESFFQSGPQAAEILVDAVARAAGDLVRGMAVDAYGGVGLFAGTVLKDASDVLVVESSAVACRDAEHNLAGRDATVLRREVGRWVHTGPNPDLVIADPARPGLGRPGVTAVCAAAPAALVLVSCDPASLARDAALLAAQGVHARSVEVLDLFPETNHVETVTYFAPDE